MLTSRPALPKAAPTPNALPEQAVARFRADTLALDPGASEERIGVAVSGGPDSLALLLLAKAAFPDVHAATVDHGLRAESVAEAAMVADICASLNVSHSILHLKAAPASGNLSAWARVERYAALDRWADAQGVALIMTAHHADDQLETLLMRLNRGAGVGGLAGIRPKRGRVVRPLLHWRKAELEAIVRDTGLVAADDPSNRNDRYDRARMRASLADADWLDPVAAARSAQALTQAEEALEWVTASLAERMLQADGTRATLLMESMPDEVARRLLLRALKQINADANPRGEELDRLLDTLRKGGKATLAGIKCAGGMRWTFEKAPPHRVNPSL